MHGWIKTATSPQASGEEDGSHSSVQQRTSCHTHTHTVQSRSATPATSISRFTFSASPSPAPPTRLPRSSYLDTRPCRLFMRSEKPPHYGCIVFTCALHTNYVSGGCWCSSESSWPQQCPQGLWQEQMSPAHKSALVTNARARDKCWPHTHTHTLLPTTYLTWWFMQHVFFLMEFRCYEICFYSHGAIDWYILMYKYFGHKDKEEQKKGCLRCTVCYTSVFSILSVNSQKWAEQRLAIEVCYRKTTVNRLASRYKQDCFI